MSQTKRDKAEATATPGPWRVEGRKIIAGKGFSSVLAEVHEYETAEGEANARLIAAAPTMREALRECIESLSRLPDVDGAYRVTVLSGARAALALVNGGEGR